MNEKVEPKGKTSKAADDRYRARMLEALDQAIGYLVAGYSEEPPDVRKALDVMRVAHAVIAGHPDAVIAKPDLDRMHNALVRRRGLKEDRPVIRLVHATVKSVLGVTRRDGSPMSAADRAGLVHASLVRDLERPYRAPELTAMMGTFRVARRNVVAHTRAIAALVLDRADISDDSVKKAVR